MIKVLNEILLKKSKYTKENWVGRNLWYPCAFYKKCRSWKHQVLARAFLQDVIFRDNFIEACVVFTCMHARDKKQRRDTGYTLVIFL